MDCHLTLTRFCLPENVIFYDWMRAIRWLNLSTQAATIQDDIIYFFGDFFLRYEITNPFELGIKCHGLISIYILSQLFIDQTFSKLAWNNRNVWIMYDGVKVPLSTFINNFSTFFCRFASVLTLVCCLCLL